MDIKTVLFLDRFSLESFGKGGLFSPSPITLRRDDSMPNDSNVAFTFPDLFSESF